MENGFSICGSKFLSEDGSPLSVEFIDIDEYFGIKSLVQDPTGEVLDDDH